MREATRLVDSAFFCRCPRCPSWRFSPRLVFFVPSNFFCYSVLSMRNFFSSGLGWPLWRRPFLFFCWHVFALSSWRLYGSIFFRPPLGSAHLYCDWVQGKNRVRKQNERQKKKSRETQCSGRPLRLRPRPGPAAPPPTEEKKERKRKTTTKKMPCADSNPYSIAILLRPNCTLFLLFILFFFIGGLWIACVGTAQRRVSSRGTTRARPTKSL